MATDFWVDAASLGSLGPGNWTAGGITPHVDIVEGNDEVCIFVELAGVKEEDIVLAMEDGVLTVAGEKAPHNRQEWRQCYYLAERAFGVFRRSIRLPAGLDEDASEASFTDGVLMVRVPRRSSSDVPE